MNQRVHAARRAMCREAGYREGALGAVVYPQGLSEARREQRFDERTSK